MTKPIRQPALIEIDGKRYLWRDIIALRRAQIAERRTYTESTLREQLAEDAAAAVEETGDACMYRYCVHYEQRTVREVVIDAHDAEEAIALVNRDIFTTRDISQLAACYLGSFRAKRMGD
jgi:histidinol dehydrogenase